MKTRQITFLNLLAPLLLLAPLAEAQRPTKSFVPASRGLPPVQKVRPPADAAPTQATPTPLRDPEAQAAPGSLTAAGPQVDFSRVYFDQPGNGDLWVRAASYKARFGRDAVEFIPFLGSSAPRNYPVRLSLEAVRVGGVDLDLARHVEPLRTGGALSEGGDVVSYDRGGVVEHYVIETGSIEQRFRLDQPPTEVGDLVIKVALETDLDCATQDADGFCFSNELGGVRYGRAVVFDDAGLLAASPTRLVDGGIEIEVSADFLARAQYPLTVDPLVSAFSVDNSGFSTAYPDVAFDETNQVYAVVWEHYFSLNDNDIWVQTHSTTGFLFPGSGFWIDTTSDNWVRPKIANNNLADQFLVVATRGGYSGEIWGRTRSAASIAMGPQFRIDGQEFGLKSAVEVGGDPDTVSPTYYCVVWQNNADTDDHDIHARMVTTSSTNLGVTFALDGSTGDDVDPTISKSCGMYPWGSQRWTVVWARYEGSGNYDLYGSQIAWSGVVTEPTFPIEVSATNDLYASVSTILDGGVGGGGSGPRPYLVAWHNDSDIWGKVMQADTALTPRTNLTALEGGLNQAFGQLTPCVESDGSTFVLAYAESRPGTGYDIYVAEYDYAGGQLYCTDPNRVAAQSTQTEINPKLIARRSGGGSGGDFMAVWQQINGVNAADAEGAILTSEGFGHTYCTSFFNSSGELGRVRMLGSRSLANQTLTLVADRCPGNKPGLFFLGSGQLNLPFGDGRRCVGGAVKRLPVVSTNSSGVVAQHIVFGTNYASGIVAGGNGVNYQFWFRDPQGGPQGFNLTSALHVEHTP